MVGKVQQEHIGPLHAAARFGPTGPSDFVFVCEHASSYIPPELNDLGLARDVLSSHAAWDIGALDLAMRLSASMQAPLIAGAVSRLVYDCNRPFEAPDSTPVKSEVYRIEGNEGLPEDARVARHVAIHDPFHATVSDAMDAAGAQSFLITIHSFTPVFHGHTRDTEIGLLCDKDARLAEHLMRLCADVPLTTAINMPYGPGDGVMHTLHLHGEKRAVPHVMLEVRNDLIDTPAKAQALADQFAPLIRQARAALAP